MMDALEFDFYGVTLRVSCDDSDIRRRIQGDFAFFETDAGVAGNPTLTITGRLQPPSYDALPDLQARVYTPRNICYPDGDVTYIDYFGRALSRYDRKQGRLDIESGDVHRLHEVIFLSILSRIAEALERRHMHRVHALAIESGGEAALFMMPSGGGKTSLAMEFMRRDVPYRVLSEDSPLIDAQGRVLPFPLRFGIKSEDEPEGFAAEHVVYLERMEFEPKYLISLDAFEGSIADAPARPRFLFIGRRSLGKNCSIRQVGLLTGLRSLMRDMVVGVGLYQGVEFLFQSSALDLWRSAHLFVSRLMRAITLLRSSEVFVADFGRDRDHNASEVIAFLDAKGFGGGGAPRASSAGTFDS